MDKVYIVTEGEYSDYHVCGVFTSREKAEKFRDTFCCNDTIEEYNLNPYQKQIDERLKPFRVYMDKEGSTDKYGVDQTGVSSMNEGEETYFYIEYHAGAETYIVCRIWAKDEKHAIKITNEKRVQHIANGTWGKNIYED